MKNWYKITSIQMEMEARKISNERENYEQRENSIIN